MPESEKEHLILGEAGLSPEGPGATNQGEEGPNTPEREDQFPDEIPFRTPFPRPRAGALRNILATIAVGLVIVGLIWFFDRPGGGFGSDPITLSAAATGPAPRVGKEAPDFRVRDLDGQYFQLSEVRGSPVWISFWATWCPSCRAENPDIDAVYREKRDEGLVLITLSIGESADTVRDYMERTGFTFPVGLDQDTAIAARYRIVGVPTHYFVDRDGILRDWRIGGMSKKTMEKKVEGIMSPSEGESGGEGPDQ
jgi:peroxiredoxin